LEKDGASLTTLGVNVVKDFPINFASPTALPLPLIIAFNEPILISKFNPIIVQMIKEN
jgi:hypothetical protein